VVEVPVAYEQVSYSLEGYAGAPQTFEDDGAAGGVEEERFPIRNSYGDAGLRPLRVQGGAGTETDHMPHGVPPALLCWMPVRACRRIVGHVGVRGNGTSSCPHPAAGLRWARDDDFGSELGAA
jgi:hypothetical protein